MRKWWRSVSRPRKSWRRRSKPAARSVRDISWRARLSRRSRSSGRRAERGASSFRLALGELEAGAGAALTVLLALLDARVARHEARLLERRAERRVDLHQRAGDAVL